MKPTVAVDIIDRDRTGAGQKSAEARFGKFAKRTADRAKESGFAKLGKQLEGLAKFRNLALTFEGAGRTFSTIGGFAAGAGQNVAGLTANFLSFGRGATGALGEVAEGAAGAAGAVAGLAAVVGGLDVAAYMLGEKWAKTGAEIDRTSKTLSVNADMLQRARAANERFGVSAEQTDSALDALGSTLYDAQYGANNLALGAMRQLGVQLKHTKDGAVDVAAAYDDISDAIARQKDPLVQRKLAAIFGLSSALPAIRQGSKRLKAEGQDFASSGAELSPEEIAKAAQTAPKTIAVRQHLGAMEKGLGVAAMSVTDSQSAAALAAMRNPSGVLAAVQHGAEDLAHKSAQAAANLVQGGEEAGRRLIDGGREAGRVIADEFERFTGRIEHRESRGNQFRHGKPLVSGAGAVGAMQVILATGKRAAARAGIPFDEERFYHDKAYNERIGTAELFRLYQKYGGDETLAAAAYNAGEGRLDGFRKNGRRIPGWLQTIGDPRKGQISDEEFASRIPFKETRDYVAATAAGGKTQVEIVLKGAPSGTVARVAPGPGADVNLKVARSLDGL